MADGAAEDNAVGIPVLDGVGSAAVGTLAVTVFTLTQEVTRLRSGGVVTDPFGNEVPGAPAEDQVMVFAWWVGSSGEPYPSGHVERVESDASLIAAPGDFVQSDRVILPGVGVFEVEGRPANFDNNPWWSPGVETVALRMVEG